MSILELRKALGLSQRKFAEKFGIPLGTIRNWEQGYTKAPDYVFTMVEKIARREYMLNYETIKAIGTFNELAARSANGVKDFKEATEDTAYTCLFYDSSTLFLDEANKHPIVKQSLVCEGHHDAIALYDDLIADGFGVYAIVEEGEEPCVCVDFLNGDSISISDGVWCYEEDESARARRKKEDHLLNMLDAAVEERHIAEALADEERRKELEDYEDYLAHELCFGNKKEQLES